MVPLYSRFTLLHSVKVLPGMKGKLGSGNNNRFDGRWELRFGAGNKNNQTTRNLHLWIRSVQKKMYMAVCWSCHKKGEKCLISTSSDQNAYQNVKSLKNINLLRERKAWALTSMFSIIFCLVLCFLCVAWDIYSIWFLKSELCFNFLSPHISVKLLR